MLAMRNKRVEFKMFRSVAGGGNEGGDEIPCGDVIGRVEERFLAEQGIEDSKFARHMLACSLHYPFEIYLALLSEEIRFLNKHQEELLGVSGLDLLLDEHGPVLEQMNEFRDAILHPVPGKYEDGVASFVAMGGPVHQLVDYIQFQVDDCIERTRSVLRLGVESLLTELPDEQAAYCRFASLGMMDCSEGTETPHGHCSRAVAKSLEEIRSITSLISLIERNGGRVWQPDVHERTVAERLAGALADTFPVQPRLLDDEGSAVSPMQDGVVVGALRAMMKDGAQWAVDPIGRRVADVVENADAYHGLLLRSLVFFNECAALMDKYGPDPLVWERGDRILGAGLMRVAHATLVPVFQGYLGCRRDHWEIRIAALEEIVDDEAHLHAVVGIRNEVFHADSPRVGPDHVMGGLEDMEFTSRFITALAEFVGGLLAQGKGATVGGATAETSGGPGGAAASEGGVASAASRCDAKVGRMAVWRTRVRRWRRVLRKPRPG